MVVTALGLLLAAMVHPADVQDRDGARLVFSDRPGRLPGLKQGPTVAAPAGWSVGL